MAYVLTKERAKHIDDNLLHQLSYIEETPDSEVRALFETMTNPWEVHYFVSEFSWGIDLTVLTWIIDSELCDKGTALMLFWRPCPNFYTRYATQAEADSDHFGFIHRVLRKIMSNWESGFYVNQRIAYDPRLDINVGSGEFIQEPNAKWAIPDYMREPILGEDLIVEK